jgi:hypothetical protein
MIYLIIQSSDNQDETDQQIKDSNVVKLENFRSAWFILFFTYLTLGTVDSGEKVIDIVFENFEIELFYEENPMLTARARRMQEHNISHGIQEAKKIASSKVTTTSSG